MQIRSTLIGMVLLFGTAASASAQFAEADPEGPPVGETRLQRMEIGVVVTATRGPCRGVNCYTTVPIDWPEQEVKIVHEEVTPNARIRYVPIGDTAKMMEVRIAMLQPGEEAKAVVTFEVRRSSQLAPDEADTATYVIPESKSMDRTVRIFLAPSPKIESRDRKIRVLAREIGVDEENAWNRVEAIYDWVREKVEYKNGPLKGALAALNSGTGDCEELTSLFIAICRAAEIPARTVWVDGHCYPEFYLADAEGKGHWFPCQAAGTRAFGGIPEFRPVLSKGDNFRPPYDRRDIQRYPADKMIGTGGQPRVKFIRKTEAG